MSLVVRGLDVGYRRRVVVPDVCVEALHGELTALVGPNGAGKSTLLRTLAGLRRPLAGSAELDGADLLAMPAAERARRVAVVLTDRVEAGLLTGRELVGLGRYPHTGATGVLSGHDREVVAAAIAAAGAAKLAERPVAELSDGERQRLLTARALAQEPRLLLLDEPTAFLDVSARVGLLAMLRRLARERDMCVVISTHELESVLRLADRLWLLDGAGLRSDRPDELVASGAIGAVFDTDELAFDPLTGTFQAL